MILHHPRQGADVRDPEMNKLIGPDDREKLLHDPKPPSRAGSAAVRAVDASEEHSGAFDRVGLLYNEPPGLPFI